MTSEKAFGSPSKATMTMCATAEEYKVVTDTTGYMSLYKMAFNWPRTWHISSISRAAAESTGAAICFNADVPAIAKVDLKLD